MIPGLARGQSARLPSWLRDRRSQLPSTVKHHHEAHCGANPVGWLAATTNQVIDVVQALGCLIELAPWLLFVQFDRAPRYQSRQRGAYLVDTHPRTTRDFGRRDWVPLFEQCNKNLTFLSRQRIQMSLEVLRVVVDKVN